MTQILIDETIDITDFVLTLPEIVFSLSFENNFFLEPIQIDLFDKKKYLRNLLSNDPCRMKVSVTNNGIETYIGKIKVINQIDENTIQFDIIPTQDYSIQVVETYQPSNYNFHRLISRTLDDLNINYNDNCLRMASAFINNDSRFRLAHGVDYKLQDLLTEIVNKCGVFVYYI